jgi:phosphoribosyl 1,2-cyclic phosphate phosphodiesterase
MGQLKITVLGCGGSAGVPAAGNHWGACDPLEPKNERSRCSILVQSETTSLVIDTGPEFRQQANRADIKHIDAVLYTHYHGDHVDGIADLRGYRFRSKKLVPIYANTETLSVFRRTVPHLLECTDPIYPQILDAHEIPASTYGQSMRIGDIEFIPFEQDHQTCMTLGFRFGDFAYSVDVHKLDKKALDILNGVKTWLVDSTGYHMTDNLVHISLSQIYEYNETIGAQNVILTSLTPAMDYKTLLEETPEGYFPAYDGLTLTAQG